jgi:hypothetical protein
MSYTKLGKQVQISYIKFLLKGHYETKSSLYYGFGFYPNPSHMFQWQKKFENLFLNMKFTNHQCYCTRTRGPDTQQKFGFGSRSYTEIHTKLLLITKQYIFGILTAVTLPYLLTWWKEKKHNFITIFVTQL